MSSCNNAGNRRLVALGGGWWWWWWSECLSLSGLYGGYLTHTRTST